MSSDSEGLHTISNISTMDDQSQLDANAETEKAQNSQSDVILRSPKKSTLNMILNEINEKNSDVIKVSNIIQTQNGVMEQSVSESFMNGEEPKENNLQEILLANCPETHQAMESNTGLALTTTVSVESDNNIISYPTNVNMTDPGTLNGDCNKVCNGSSITENVIESTPMGLANSRNASEPLGSNGNLLHDKVSNGLDNLSDKTPVCIESTSYTNLAVSEIDIEKPSTAGVMSNIEEGSNFEQGHLVENGATVKLLHRVRSIVDYSDDNDADDSSSSCSSYTPPIEDRLKEVEDEISDGEHEKKPVTAKPNLQKNKIRTEGEIFPEELPPLEYLMISPDESVQLEPLGVVSGIVDVLVVVKADNNSPALYDDTILFVEGRKPLGLVFETFGTVEKPYYSVRFNSAQDIVEMGIEVGHRVYFAPKADNLTKYVFIAELRKMKCDDASWKNDNEVPSALRDYSDDEEERKEKRRAKNKDRGVTDRDAPEGNLTQRKKKKWPGDARQDSNPNRPSLLPGELMRNPFGANPKNERFKAASSTQWQRSRPANSSNPAGPRPGGPLSGPPPPPAPHMFHSPPPRPRPGPPAPGFGQNPRWSSQFNTPPPFHQPPSPGPDCPPPVGHPPFSFSSSNSLPPFGRPPFSGSNMPSFSSPCPPPFHPSGESPAVPNFNSPSNSQQKPPSFPPQFRPPPPTGYFGLRPARFNFNPAVPPPALFSGTSLSPQQPQSNSHQRFQS